MENDLKLNQICQCCLVDHGTMKDMVMETYQNLKLVENLKICSGLDLLDGQFPDAGIRNICTKCEALLKVSFDFREQCHNSQKLLRERSGLIGVVKDEPVSDDEPLILYTQKIEKRKGGRSGSTATFTQVYVKTSAVPVVKIENESTTLKYTDDNDTAEMKVNSVGILKEDEDTSRQEDDFFDNEDQPNQTSYDSETSEEDSINSMDEDYVDSKDPTWKMEARYICFMCDEYKSTYAEYIKHRNGHYVLENRGEKKQINRNCVVCKKDVAGYVKHLLNEHSEYRPNSCIRCNLTFRQQGQLKGHLVRHSKIRKYKCLGCPLVYKSHSGLTSHLNNFQHKKGYYQCIKCGLSYKKFQDLDDHLHRVHDKRMHKHFFPCYNCKRVFALSKSVIKHNCKPFVSKKRKETSLNNPSTLKHKCPVCDQRFVDSEEMLCHKISLCVGRYMCTFEGCGKMFVKQRSLSHHYNQEHNATKMCDQCGFTTHLVNKMKWHKKKEHSSDYKKVWENLPCPHQDCGKVLHSKHAYDTHISNFHSGPRQLYECYLCVMKFRSFTAIQNHMVQHLTPESLYGCSICEKMFVTEVARRNHMKGHRNRANNVMYKCDMCPKEFNSPSNLGEHKQRLHEGKYYECCYCHNHFSGKEVLKYHMFEHRGFKPFNCPACPSQFVRQYLFVPHLKKHGITFDKNIHGYVEKEDLSQLLKSCERKGGMNQRPQDLNNRSNKC